MAIKIEEPIVKREQIEDLSFEDFSDEKVFERLASDLNDPQYYNEVGKAIEFATALRASLAKYVDLKEAKPGLYEKYEALITLLEIFAIPTLGPNKLQEIFGNYLVFATVHNTQANVPPENFMAMWETLQECNDTQSWRDA